MNDERAPTCPCGAPPTDEQRVARYRRKLEDLPQRSGELLDSFPAGSVPPCARRAYDLLAQERRVIRVQLDVERAFLERRAATPEG